MDSQEHSSDDEDIINLLATLAPTLRLMDNIYQN